MSFNPQILIKYLKKYELNYDEKDTYFTIYYNDMSFQLSKNTNFPYEKKYVVISKVNEKISKDVNYNSYNNYYIFSKPISCSLGGEFIKEILNNF